MDERRNEHRSDEVESWFAEQAHPLEAELRQVRDIILDSDDRITESIKWKTPTFSYRGNIVSFSPAKRFVSLMFHRGAEIPGDHPGLEGDGKLVRTLRLADQAEITARRGELEAIIAAWCRLRDA